MKKQLFFVIFTLFFLQFIVLALAQDKSIPIVPRPITQDPSTTIIFPLVKDATDTTSVLLLWILIVILPIALSIIYFVIKRNKKSKLILWVQTLSLLSIISIAMFIVYSLLFAGLELILFGLFFIVPWLAIPLAVGIILFIIHFVYRKHN